MGKNLPTTSFYLDHSHKWTGPDRSWSSSVLLLKTLELFGLLLNKSVVTEVGNSLTLIQKLTQKVNYKIRHLDYWTRFILEEFPLALRNWVTENYCQIFSLASQNLDWHWARNDSPFYPQFPTQICFKEWHTLEAESLSTHTSQVQLLHTGLMHFLLASKRWLLPIWKTNKKITEAAAGSNFFSF